MLINQLLLIVSMASLGSKETSEGKKKKKTPNKNWAAVIVFKFIKTKYIIFYEAVLKWVTEGEHIDWERMNFSNFCSLETEFNYKTRQTG